MAENQNNPMKSVYLEKVTINICVGNDPKALEKAEKLLVKMTNRTPVNNTARKRIARWRIRRGVAIGKKVTLRGKEARDFLKWVLESKENKLNFKSIDENGNFSVGFPEYLEMKGLKYDAEIDIMGFEVMATFARRGFRIKRRRLAPGKTPQRHKTNREEVSHYLKENYGVVIE